eukprot:TRINITY_DN9809_c0_g2_i1.p3 TRINITY_DN9809_c0_g2~~TRINITY_DN9809_c0_g2_i1.p3  ORF type:complete len:100 (+),score=1.48 TRINITY_DN9809_c0_g2_i1:589-888(+)
MLLGQGLVCAEVVLGWSLLKFTAISFFRRCLNHSSRESLLEIIRLDPSFLPHSSDQPQAHTFQGLVNIWHFQSSLFRQAKAGSLLQTANPFGENGLKIA